MKNLKEFLLACFVLIGITSCFVANEPPPEGLEDTTNVEDAKLRWPSANPTQPWTTDIPVKDPKKCTDIDDLDLSKEQACVEGDSCVVIDRGCCAGEKKSGYQLEELGEC